MPGIWTKLFRLVIGITGVAECLIGLAIVFYAARLQQLLATGLLSEPLNLRILGMMDFWIGVLYILIGWKPERYLQLNRATYLLRLGLSIVFFIEGFWLLEDPDLRIMYQALAFFDLFLAIIQSLFDRSARGSRV